MKERCFNQPTWWIERSVARWQLRSRAERPIHLKSIPRSQVALGNGRTFLEAKLRVAAVAVPKYNFGTRKMRNIFGQTRTAAEKIRSVVPQNRVPPWRTITLGILITIIFQRTRTVAKKIREIVSQQRRVTDPTGKSIPTTRSAVELVSKASSTCA